MLDADADDENLVFFFIPFQVYPHLQGVSPFPLSSCIWIERSEASRRM